jgi:tetratricopeptide (TPR) repeat protein
MEKIDELIKERSQLNIEMNDLLIEYDKIFEFRRELMSSIKNETITNISKKKKSLDKTSNLAVSITTVFVFIFIFFKIKGWILHDNIGLFGYLLLALWSVLVLLVSFIISLVSVKLFLIKLLFNSEEKKIINKEEIIHKSKLVEIEKKNKKDMELLEFKKDPIRERLKEISENIKNYEKLEEEKIKVSKLKTENEEQIKKNKELEIKRKIEKKFDYYYSQGIAKIKLKQFDLAVLDFSRAIKLKPNNFELHYTIGLCKVYSHKFHEAILDFTKSLNLGNNKSNLFLERGKAYKQIENYKNAISDFKKFIESTNKNSEGYYERATTKMKLGDKRGALSDFNESIKINSMYKEAFFYRGIIKNELKDKNGACDDWSRAGELGYFEAYEKIKEFCN